MEETEKPLLDKPYDLTAANVTFDTIPNKSSVFEKTLQLGRRLAKHPLSILIEGESGVGKESFARALHNESPRKNEPFVAVNCGGFPHDLIGAELFGYSQGAFTGAEKPKDGIFKAATGGTVFLDEIGELPINQQTYLLRVLQEGKIRPIGSTEEISVDVRVIAATNVSLTDAIARRQFREDLYYRLAVGKVTIPSLRERGMEDVSYLLDLFLQECNEKYVAIMGLNKKIMDKDARKALQYYSWPGNIRELKNLITRLAIVNDGVSITLDHVRQELAQSANAVAISILERPIYQGFKLKDVHEELIRHYYKRALDQTSGNKEKAAHLLGMKRLTKKWLP